MTNTIKHGRGKGSLNESEARLRRILDSVVAFVGTLTPQGILTEANEPALVVANLSRHDVIGKPFWDCYWWNYSADVQQQLRAAVEQAAAGDTVRYDVDIRIADGAMITIDFKIAPSLDAEGNIVELIPSGVDITDRKLAEDQLKRSHDTFLNMVQLAPFGVFIVDAQFRLAQISTGCEKVFSGVNPLIGRDFAEVLLILWPEPFANEAIGRFRHTLATGESYRSTDTTEKRADIADTESYDWEIQRMTLPSDEYGVVCYFYDLTRQKNAELALAESRKAYRVALQAARSGAWEWDVAADQMAWSPELARLLAIERDNLPVDLDSFISLLPQEDRGKFRAALQRNLDHGGDEYEIECRILRGDGSGLQWIRGRGRIDRDDQGTPTRVVGLISDIDELRLAQIATAERDEHIEALLNSTAEGIYGIDVEGVCTFANPACAALLGFASPDELIGENMHDLVHHHHASGMPYPLEDCRIYHSFKSGERTHVEDEVFWRKDGSSFPVEYWSHPIRGSGRTAGSVVTFLDISARRSAEQDLRTAAERLGLALEVGEMGVWDWDLNSGIVEWSDYHYALAGYSVGEVTPSYEAWRVRVHPDDLPDVEAALQLARDHKTGFENSYRFQHSDGKIVHVFGRGRYFYENDQPVRMIGVLDNITKLKAAEEHREMLMGELNHRVKNTLATIQAMASHTMRSAPDTASFRDAFAGRLRAISAAHEILFSKSQRGARLTDLVERQVGPYADVNGNQVRLDGPDVLLGPNSAHALGLVLHELATNASKYGALSASTGHIDINWKTVIDNDRQMVLVDWRESGGPLVSEPERKGFGSRLIEQTLTHSLDGEIDLVYDPDGFNAFIKLPMEAGYG